MTPVCFSVIPFVLSLASSGCADTTSTNSVGQSEPTPSGTIFFDTRAGGAQDLNKFNDWGTAQRIFDSGFRGPVTLDPNFDGRGKHAIRFDWTQRGVVDPEEDAAVEKRVQA